MGRGLPKAVAIIPARMGSTRFPGKALADETGKPMVVHVCEQASKAESVDRVVVATDAEEIKTAVETHGFEAVMTSEDHPNGSSRLIEASEKLKLDQNQVIINVQGDEPEIAPEVITAAWNALGFPKGKFSGVGTVVTPIDSQQEFEDPNIVKAVVPYWQQISDGESYGWAIYFSRSPVPYQRVEPRQPPYRHVGIYAYKVSDLQTVYGQRQPNAIELTESLEQLRWYCSPAKIKVALCESTHSGIDTPEQYRAFVDRWSAKN